MELKTKRLILVVIQVDKGGEELLPEDVYKICNGTWIEERDDETVLIHFYPRSVEELLPLLDKSGLRYQIVSITEEEDRDYVALMKQHFTPISVGNITILPPWKKSRRPGMKVIIEPGMAFGTGRHESTKIMLKMMNAISLNGMSVIDIGCGSGILAICAHMIGAGRVTAVDHDICAVEAVNKNAALNAAERIQVVCANLGDLKGQFDVVLANLDARTFSHWSEHIAGLVKDGGLLLVSGIEAAQKNEVLPLFSCHRRIARRRMKTWYGFTFQVRQRPRHVSGSCIE